MLNEKEGENSNPYPYMNRGVRISRLLVAGWWPSRIAKQLGVSEGLVRKYARKYEGEGKIERVCKYPAIWKGKEPIRTPTMSGTQSVPFGPIMLPHNLGASFVLVGSPRGKRDGRGFINIKTPSYTARLGRSKAVLWLKSFRGTNVKEQLENGRKDVLALGEQLARDYGVTLTFARWFDGVEWCLNDRPASALVGDKADLKANPKVIAGALVKFDDFSHPHFLEVETANGFPRDRPTVVADRLEYLINSAPAIGKAFEAISEYDRNIKKHLAVMDDMSATMKDIRDGLKKMRGE
jgi:hypothetical protein